MVVILEKNFVFFLNVARKMGFLVSIYDANYFQLLVLNHKA